MHRSCFALGPRLLILRALLPIATALAILPGSRGAAPDTAAASGRFLYVAVPGIRDYLEYGGHGVLVFDIDHGHKFVRRIKSAGVDANGKPLNVKGVCAHAGNKRLYVSTIKTLTCMDLATGQVLWERAYDGGCDRMSISPDGSKIYTPSLEGAHWHVLEARNGDVMAKIVPNSGAHNTIVGLDGSRAYLAGLKSPVLTVINTANNSPAQSVGPFGNVIRPFTVNGGQTLCFVNVNELLGFEVGDLRTGKLLHRVVVQGWEKGPTKRHGCPSHGIGLTPDEKELWLTDAHNSRLHIFDATVMPPKQLASLELCDQPGWVTFSLDGRYGYPSTGDVIDTATRKIVATLKDETGQDVQSEKMIEIDFEAGVPVRNGDQFGLGRVR
jgi:DNA-binding beta-propeller fold protein YncE